MSAQTLTTARRRALEVLGEKTEAHAETGIAPRALARVLWPDSPAWNRVTRGRGASGASGSVGGTMPMLAAKLLWALADQHLAAKADEHTWTITDRGRATLEEGSK